MKGLVNLFVNHPDDLHEERDNSDDEKYVSNDDGDNNGCDRRPTQSCKKQNVTMMTVTTMAAIAVRLSPVRNRMLQ